MKVILVMAVTADGLIARDSMELINWTGKADKKYFVQVTRDAEVMIMGSKTFDTIGKVLPGRKSIVMTRDKQRVSQHEDLIYTGQTPHKIIDELRDQGFDTVTLIGGAIINTLFMQENLIDEIHITMVPKIFGKGLSLFCESLDVELTFLEAVTIDQGAVLLKYRVKKQSI